MTIPRERTRAVLQTREFLVSLLHDEDTFQSVRNRVSCLLRHYPSSFDMEQAAKKAPEIFGMDTNEEAGNEVQGEGQGRPKETR